MFNILNIIIVGLILAACSPRQELPDLPNYSDMGAAADAGKIVAPSVPEGI